MTNTYPSYKLTFGIPTYNGSKYISNTLSSILSQLNPTTAKSIEILIVDNNSTDDTGKIVNSFSNQLNIRYIKNEQNIGFDKNVLKVISNSLGDFVWLLADDDSLEDGALAYVLDVIDKNKDLGLVLVNFNHYDRCLKEVHDRVTLKNDGLYLSAADFLRDSKSRYSLISSLIFSRNFLLGRSFESVVGLNFIHVYMMMAILKDRPAYIIATPLVKFRTGSENFQNCADSAMQIALNYGVLLRNLIFLDYDVCIVNKLVGDARIYTFRAIIPAKLQGISDKKLLISRLIKTFNHPTLYLKWIPIIVFPDSFFSSIYSCKKKVSYFLKRVFSLR
jgi:glycosyltransferase involved in cell wall biosynthesis